LNEYAVFNHQDTKQKGLGNTVIIKRQKK